VDIRAVAEKLGVQFIVEGSVRRAGNRVRITVQLIEAETGDHVWAERYDRDLEDVFAVQDEVTRNIVGVLPGRVIRAVAHRAMRRPPDSVQAYEVMLQAKAMRDSFSAEATQGARRLFEKSVSLDPQYARAYQYLADTYFVDFMLGLATEESRRRMIEYSRKAIELDPSDVAIQEEHGFAYITAGQWDDASAQFDRAIAQIGIESEQLLWCAYGLLMLGRHEEALAEVRRAKSYDPLHPPSFDWVLGQALFFAGDYEAASNTLRAGALLNSLAYACLAGAYAFLGQAEQARAALEEFISVRHSEFRDRDIPITDDTVETLIGGYRPVWRRREDWDLLAQGLRRAGLPA
jgi:Tfp pilus assembly protein PilF